MRGFTWLGVFGLILGAWAGPAPRETPRELMQLSHNEVLGIVGTKVITVWDILREVEDVMAREEERILNKFSIAFRFNSARLVLLTRDHAEAEKELAATKAKLKAVKDKGGAAEVARLEKEVGAQHLKLVEMGKDLDKMREQLAELDSIRVEQMGQMRNSLVKAVVAQRIDDQLLVQDFKNKRAEASKMPIYQPPPGLVDTLLASFMKKEKKNREQLTLYLRREGITYAEFRENLLDKTLLRHINNQTRMTVSPRKIRDFYERHKVDRYSRGRVVTLRHLSLPVDKYPDIKAAREASETVKALSDLQKLAEDTGVDMKSSSLVWRGKEEAAVALSGRKEINEIISDAAKGLNEGEGDLVKVSGVGDKAVFVVIFVEKEEKNKVIPLEEVRGQIEKELVGRVHAAKRKRELTRIRLTIPNFNFMK